MGGMIRCPKCGDYMFMYFDYQAALPIVYHQCNCGYSNRNDYIGFDNKTNLKEGAMSARNSTICI